MFQAEKKKTLRKREDDFTIPFEEHVRLMRQQMQEERNKVPQLKKKMNEIRKKATVMTKYRHLQRASNDLFLESNKLEEEIKMIESCDREVEYDLMITPYVRAYRRSCPEDARPAIRQKTKSSGNLDDFISTQNTQHGTILAEYLSEINGAHPKMSLAKQDICNMCSANMILLSSRAIMTCPSCGYATTYLDATSSNMSYGDEVDFTSFSYKRINHFNEWLQQVQAKENFEVEDEVIDKVIEDLYKQRIQTHEITHQKVRDSLKRLKFRKAYEHVVQITSKITGVPPPRMTPEMEETCRLMFMAVQPAFEVHCPPDRKNFLSYSYCLYKFFQLLGYDELLASFSLLKGKDKLAKQDIIFEKICKDLDWTFISSV